MLKLLEQVMPRAQVAVASLTQAEVEGILTKCGLTMSLKHFWKHSSVLVALGIVGYQTSALPDQGSMISLQDTRA